jgi:hypothetical protein
MRLNYATREGAFLQGFSIVSALTICETETFTAVLTLPQVSSGVQSGCEVQTRYTEIRLLLPTLASHECAGNARDRIEVGEVYGSPKLMTRGTDLKTPLLDQHLHGIRQLIGPIVERIAI